MNRRGFTFVELLGVIVLLGLILIIAIPSITDALRISKIKSEEVFLNKLSDTIDSYVTMHSDMEFEEVATGRKVSNSEEKEVSIYQNINVTINDMINDGLIVESDFKDPASGIACNQNASVEIYRDEDYVYCHTIEASQLGCLTDDYLEENCTANEIANKKCYIIDTCIWE